MSEKQDTSAYEEILEEVISAEEYCLDEETVEALPDYIQSKLDVTSVEVGCTLIENDDEEEVQILSISVVEEDGKNVQMYAAINEDQETVEFGDIDPEEDGEDEEGDFEDFDNEEEEGEEDDE